MYGRLRFAADINTTGHTWSKGKIRGIRQVNHHRENGRIAHRTIRLGRYASYFAHNLLIGIRLERDLCRLA